jgi:hypothetical protein
VLDHEWELSGAFSGHDHADRPFCEDE